MKKTSLLASLFFCIACCLCSCQREGECRVLIVSITDNTLVASSDSKEITFDITQTVYTNGAVMSGDSAVIDYKGDRALSIRFIETEGRVIELDELRNSDDALLTKPVTDEE